MSEPFKFSAGNDPDRWDDFDWDQSVIAEFPCDVTALWVIGDSLFCQLEDGRTVDCTSAANRTKH